MDHPQQTSKTKVEIDAPQGAEGGVDVAQISPTGGAQIPREPAQRRAAQIPRKPAQWREE